MEKKSKYASALVAFLIGVILATPSELIAQTIRAAGDFLQPGDVKTSHILDRTVLNQDVSNSASIDATKINPRGTANNLLVTTGSAIGTTSPTNVKITTNDFYIYGGRVHATSTNFNGVSMTWPSADGANGTALTTNGSGTLSWSSTASSYTTSTGTAGEDLVQGQAVFIATSTTPTLASATQTQESGSDWLGQGTGNTRVGQEIQFTETMAINTVIVKLKKNGAPTDLITLSIQANTGDDPTGTMLASATLDGSTLTTTLTEKTFTFTNPITLTKNTQYHIVLQRAGANDAVNNYEYSYKLTGDVYANGDLESYNGSVWTDSTGNDMYFKTQLTRTTGRLYLADASSYNESAFVVGASLGTYSSGATATLYTSGEMTTSGLTAGLPYYLGNNRGELSATAGTITRKLAIALSATKAVLTGNW